ncbi:MAG: hypothetical protein ACYCRH_06610 [Acidiferrobacteraceae bacterium]
MLNVWVSQDATAMLDGLLEKHIRNGTLRIEHAGGPVLEYGSGSPHAVLRLTHPKAERRILKDPEYELGATYVDGLWETPDLAALLELLYRNFRSYVLPPLNPLGRLGRLLRQWNRRVAARRHVAHHYDLDECWIPATLELVSMSSVTMKIRYYLFVFHGIVPTCSTAQDFSMRSDVR